jgi:hypothetical protein
MAAVTDTLNAPNCYDAPEGKYALVRLWNTSDSAAQPITPTNIEGVQDITMGKPEYETTRTLYQFAAGDDRRECRSGYRIPFSITILGSKLNDFLEACLNITLDGSDNTAMPNQIPQIEIGVMEAIIRRDDNNTHIESRVFQGLIIEEQEWPMTLDDSPVTIEGYSYHPDFIVPSGYEVEMYIYDGDGSTTDFATSGNEATIGDTTTDLYKGFPLDEFFMVGVLESGETDIERYTSGISFSTPDLTFTTAPAASSTVVLGYLVATS